MASAAQRVALLCIDPWLWVDSADHRPFNYAVRRIQAAILGHPELARIELRLIESASLDVDEISAQIEAFDPDLIGVSAYVWSFPTLLEACRRAKRARPERCILFGGPSSRPEIFALPQHRDGAEVVDAICVGEGEGVIQEILLAPDQTRETLLKIPGLSIYTSDGWTYTPERKLPAPDFYPSPYQMGLMPDRVTAEIESFRGCPLSCTYCEWGDTGVDPRGFGQEHLERELVAIQKLNPRGIWLIDPGLNLHNKSFTNLQRAEANVGALKAVGHFRCEIYPSHLRDEHLRFLETAGAQYAGIGLQSYDDVVLKGMERPFSEDRFHRVVKEVASIVPDTTIEVIMGLPGDNPNTFKRTVERVRQLPVSIRVFHCLVLPSALMKRSPPSFELNYDPFTLQVISCQGWSSRDIEDTRAWLDDLGRSENADVPHAGTWKFPRPDLEQQRKAKPIPTAVVEAGRQPAPIEITSGPPLAGQAPGAGGLPQALIDSIGRLSRETTTWILDWIVAANGDLRSGAALHFNRPEGPLVVKVSRTDPTKPRYRDAQGIAYSYETRDGELAEGDRQALDRMLLRLHPIMRAVILGMKSEQKPKSTVLLPVVSSRM